MDMSASRPFFLCFFLTEGGKGPTRIRAISFVFQVLITDLFLYLYPKPATMFQEISPANTRPAIAYMITSADTPLPSAQHILRIILKNSI